jgi:hypothetical protein
MVVWYGGASPPDLGGFHFLNNKTDGYTKQHRWRVGYGGVIKALGKAEVSRSNPSNSMLDVCLHIYIYIYIYIHWNDPLIIVYLLSILLLLANIGVVHQIW